MMIISHCFFPKCLLFIYLTQVRGLEFNSISPNLLASGADEGEICIWDIAKPTEPIHFPPLKVWPMQFYLTSDLK